MAIITYVPEAKEVEAQPGEKLIDVCERENIGIPFGCQNGICATCLSRINKGMENLSAVSEHEKNTLELFTEDKQLRLVCQCVLEKDGDVEIDLS